MMFEPSPSIRSLVCIFPDGWRHLGYYEDTGVLMRRSASTKSRVSLSMVRVFVIMSIVLQWLCKAEEVKHIRH